MTETDLPATPRTNQPPTRLQRIKAGTYGVCEQTAKPIPKERLTAVPFTRYTAEAMKEVEKTRYKVRGQAGIFGEGEEGGAKIEDGGDE